MSTPLRPGGAVDLEDVQGLLRRGYGHLQACFLLLRVVDRDAARRWLRDIVVTRAVDRCPETALHVAFTSQGLCELGVAAAVRDGFSREFLDGMTADAARARRLGDVDASDPSCWQWGVGDKVPHVAVLLYARPEELTAFVQAVMASYDGAFTACIEPLSTSDQQRFEPFGFRDGISQPDPDWDRRRPLGDHDRLTYDNRVCLGEFVLGYPNEYGLYTPRPLLDPQEDPAGSLPRAEDAPDRADLGRNGCYLVMRQLQQDVAGFWAELARRANGDAAEAERLAEAMVGRRKGGAPLMAENDSTQNAFTYDADPEGRRCPLGAHIRRTNPRNADFPPGTSGLVSRAWRMAGFDATARANDLVASTRFHRLLRRGRKYAEGAATGIHFICLAANIKRQFEFVQSAWLMGSRFAGQSGESDPLLGNRTPDFGGAATGGFSMPQADGPDRRLQDLPRFVTVRGGAYFFLPGIRALRYIAGAPRTEA